MKTPVLALLMAAMVLTACGRVRDSRLNPFNWFGRCEAGAQEPAALPVAEDYRLLVQQVTVMQVERVPEGAIVRATGLPPTQGWWDGDLVETSFEDGVLTYEFRLTPPLTPKPAVTPKSREVTVASFLSNIRLAEVAQIVVQGEMNARSSRR